MVHQWARQPVIGGQPSGISTSLQQRLRGGGQRFFFISAARDAEIPLTLTLTIWIRLVETGRNTPAAEVDDSRAFCPLELVFPPKTVHLHALHTHMRSVDAFSFQHTTHLRKEGTTVVLC